MTITVGIYFYILNIISFINVVLPVDDSPYRIDENPIKSV